MRLGAYKCSISKKSLAYNIYQSASIEERHRHRYEFNNEYIKQFEKNGMKISGINKTNELAEIIEYAKHPFFIAVQFHPEFKSRPLSPHPLFVKLIKAAMEKKNERNKDK
jgi:CTP synthase